MGQDMDGLMPKGMSGFPRVPVAMAVPIGMFSHLAAAISTFIPVVL
jgi:hypothetical protein